LPPQRLRPLTAAAHATVSTDSTPPAVASLVSVTSTAATATSSITTPLLIDNYLAATNVETAAADAAPTIVCPSFAIPLAVTKDTTAADAVPTTTDHLPSIHLAAGATTTVDGSTATASQCINHPPTVAPITLPAVTAHPVTLVHFTADKVSPHTASSIICTSTTDSTSSSATNIASDSSTVRFSHAVDRHQPIVDCSTVIMIPFPHVPFHVTHIIHGNTSPFYCPVGLILHAAAWTARYSTPSSNYDGI
jgi:hypothetical protein